MLVNEVSIQGVLVLIPSGRLDQHNAVALETALYRTEDKGARDIIFNLEKVYSIDSYGIGMLFLTYHRLYEKGIQLSLVNPKPEIMQVLKFVNLPNLIPTFGSTEKAIVHIETPLQNLEPSDRQTPTPTQVSRSSKDIPISVHRPLSRVSA